MQTTVLASELAGEVQPGDDLGVIYTENGRLTDVVISSCAKVPTPKARMRYVAMMVGRKSVDLYATTHCDSGHLLASVASHDVLVGG